MTGLLPLDWGGGGGGGGSVVICRERVGKVRVCESLVLDWILERKKMTMIRQIRVSRCTLEFKVIAVCPLNFRSFLIKSNKV
ncbi:hypothetical protein Hanom_Chr13g01216491 [Helianthus anomalus]